MKIISIKVNNLNQDPKVLELDFNDDVNIITGRNGSGKTTILKLLWYCVSGNIERAIREISFSRVELYTTKYHLTLEKHKSKSKSKSKSKEMIHIFLENDEEIFIDKDEPIHRDDAVESANMKTTDLLKTSIFFPTFRRIEGGFSMDDGEHHVSKRTIRIIERELLYHGDGDSRIQDALEGLADRLSVKRHKFVSSISTRDIKRLVTKRHNEATTIVDNSSKSLSVKIVEEINNYKATDTDEKEALRNAASTLDKINIMVNDLEKVRQDSFKSLTVLSEIIVDIFQHKGIRLNPSVTLGDIDNSINSDLLSAGEKQMLSFLCYNSLYSNCPFFIDEPELSLHVDWQRILLDIMVQQSTDNQYFIATHSPFIYAQFADKEIMMGENRGNENES